MIVLPSRRALLATAPLVFRAADCLDENGLFARGYGQRLAATFTRASRKRVADQRGRLVAVPNGSPALGVFGGEVGLLLEPARTNPCIRSEEFHNAAWVKSSFVTVSANALASPDGQVTADLLTHDGGGTFSAVYQEVAFTGDGEKCAAVYLKAGSAGTTAISLYDNTTATHRHRINVTWTNGVPSLSTAGGTGTLYPVEALAGGWYRILFSATGIVAANTNRLLIYPAGTAAVAGTVYAWGAQAEDAAVPSSYIPTAGSTVTRNADSLYFPFTLRPTAMTVLVRGREQTRATDSAAGQLGLVYIGDAAASDPTFGLINRSGSPGYSAYHDPATSSVTGTTIGSAVTRGDLIELRGGIRATGAAFASISVNGGAEAISIDGSEQAVADEWSGQRLYLNSQGTVNVGQFAFTHICVAIGERTLDEMRGLAGV